MWIWLLILALLLYRPKESFSVKIDASLPSMDIAKHMNTVTEGIQNYTTRPLYNNVMAMIPYKDVYRKFRRFHKKL